MFKKLLKRQNVQSQIISGFTPATNLKNGTNVLKLKLVTHRGKIIK